MSEATGHVPENVQPIIEELVDRRMLSTVPELTTHQWDSIAEIVEPFAYGGANKQARHVRRRNAYFLIISEALAGQ